MAADFTDERAIKHLLLRERKPARFLEVKAARMKRLRVEGEPGRRGQDLMEYEAALRFIAWHTKSGIDL